MEIGKPIRTVTVEPIQDPVPQREQRPPREPVEVPEREREREPVPAGT